MEDKFVKNTSPKVKVTETTQTRESLMYIRILNKENGLFYDGYIEKEEK